MLQSRHVAGLQAAVSVRVMRHAHKACPVTASSLTASPGTFPQGRRPSSASLTWLEAVLASSLMGLLGPDRLQS